MTILRKVSAWLEGTIPVATIVKSLVENQIVRMSDTDMENVIRMFVILSTCPAVSAKFSAAYSRTRSNKNNVSQNLVIVVKKFNDHRLNILKKIYESI